MPTDNCTLWNLISGVIGLLVGSGGTFLAIKIRSKRRDTTMVTQKNVTTNGGDVAGGNITKKR